MAIFKDTNEMAFELAPEILLDVVEKMDDHFQGVEVRLAMVSDLWVVHDQKNKWSFCISALASEDDS